MTNEKIIDGFRARIGGEQVLSRLIERNAHAGDASIYRLVPRVVVLPRSIADVRSILEYCRENALYLTFRAAGTSLSGQAVTDGVLADVARHWKKLRILDGGRRVAVEPGVVGAHVNAFLASHGVRIGPDPASINACMMGGISANNASGMCCGVLLNSYHTMASMKLMLADGFYVDTAGADDDEILRRERPDIHKGLIDIRDRIRADKPLTERIRRKFSVKNTCGYSMNAFTDFERPIDILAHLLIGSEGTLGFIAEITLNTIPDPPHKATALVYFNELVDAGASIASLVDAGASVLEIMDRASMLSVKDEMNYQFDIEGNCAALLIEFQEESAPALDERQAGAEKILSRHALLAPAEFTRDPERREQLWHMRKGLFPSVGAMREMGAAVIIEDIAVPRARLAECIFDLQSLFVKHSFPDSIIFGHAKDGNLHFVICTDFAKPEQSAHYAALLDELLGMVVKKYDGALKAEHGTGRNVTPYVELEWGSNLYEIMWQVKRLLDPANVLNPGVVLNRDPKAHMKHLKVMPVVSPVVDKCIECGFCEPHCPSRGLTLTPRQRIAILREVERLCSLDDPAASVKAAQLEKEYEYFGIETCAADSMCSTACPVKIDTGAMVKELRAAQHSERAKRIAAAAARHYGTLAAGARFGLAAIRATGPVGLAIARLGAEIIHRLSNGQIARLPKGMPIPGPAPRLPHSITQGNDSAKQIIYFPSCLTRIMGKLPGERADVGLAETVSAVLDRCGWQARIPDGVDSLCCGQPFFSKGFPEAGAAAAARTIEFLWKATRGGEIPVMCDTSPCSGQFLCVEKYLDSETLRHWRGMKYYDFPELMAKLVLPGRGDWPRLERRVILHPTCTLIKQGELDSLIKVARTFASEVTVPVLAECCGFAGDKGFNTPELTRSATRGEAGEIAQMKTSWQAQPMDTRYYSTCRTCEIGMTEATGETYQSIAYLCYDALVKNRN
ncbi:MAG: FAD-binding and (Fe-S)-binding domain-containing protein [bacterium]|nr:FAD-binding and (Fe-S)-binding domain-containing protein [Candidatus Sumerlaeota bacterium]